MDFRDRQAVKRLTFKINGLKELPAVFHSGKDYDRMNDEIANNIPLEGIVLLPFSNGSTNYFIVVARSYAEAWPVFCEALKLQCTAWIATIKKNKSVATLNVDALARKVNDFKKNIEIEEKVTLEDFHYEY